MARVEIRFTDTRAALLADIDAGHVIRMPPTRFEGARYTNTRTSARLSRRRLIDLGILESLHLVAVDNAATSEVPLTLTVSGRAVLAEWKESGP